MEKGYDLISLFGDMPDPRLERKKLHQLGDIMAIAILAVICGAETWIDIEDFGHARCDWLKSFLDLPNGIPSHDTFNRVFSLIDPKELDSRFVEWVEAISGKINGQVVIDGKMIKGSGNRRNKKNPLWIVSAWAADLDLVLAHTQVSEKSNEITAIPKILEMLSVKGCIVSIDAMGCQREVARQIRQEGGDYVLALKGNQGSLQSEISNYFEQAEAINFEYVEHDFHKSYEENRGRKEERLLYVTSDINWLPMKDDWKDLQSIVFVVSYREINGVKTKEKRFYISSLSPDAQQHAKAVRNHWGIENKQHWVLDVGFNEDKCRIRDKVSGKNFATLRRLALNLLKQEPSKAGMKRKRLRAGWNEQYLKKVLG